MKETDNQFLKAVEKAKQRLAAGEKPENVFDKCGKFHEGFAWVKMSDKWNFINCKGKFLSDSWFDYCVDFCGRFAWVRLNGRYYHLRKDGVLCELPTD